MDIEEEITGEFFPPAPAQKKRGPKRKSQRKRFTQVKQRGLYKVTQCKGFATEGDDADLIECLFSDDEVKTEYNKYLADSDTISRSSVDVSDSSCGSSLLSHESGSSVLDSDSSTSRPSSHSSRPSSSLDSRPPSSSAASENSHATVQKPQFAVSSVISMSALPSEEKVHVSEMSTQCVLAVQENVCDVPQNSTNSAPGESDSCGPSIDLVKEGLNSFRDILPSPWVPIADKDGFHLLLISPTTPKSIQREVFISYNGNAAVYIQCKPIPDFKTKFNIGNGVGPFNVNCVSDFCEFGRVIAQKSLGFKVCVGANDLESRAVWEKIQHSYIDCNPNEEGGNSETCRSLSCLMLVELGHGERCFECSAVLKNIKRRKKFLLSDINPAVNNKNLTLPQAIKKLEQQQKDIRKKNNQLAYLKARVGAFIVKEGVNIDEDVSETFSKLLLDNANLSEVQRMFLNEQWSICNKSDSRAHRWHPTMIRLALSMYMDNPGNYERLRDLGVVRLPHSRTLFNYTHSIKAKGGINDELINLVQEKVQSFGEPCRKYHVLLCDGMHVSQNLVFRESDGTLVGFTDIDNIDKELERLEKYVVGQEPVPSESILATEVVAFLVKGMASDVKCVVASYAVKVLTKEMLYNKSWNVIRHLEAAGIKILAYVCDGHPVNRAFIKMHTPRHGPTKFDCTYATFNFCAPDSRNIFFVSDVCHLLKTLRNALYNSGEGEKKPRLLELNGETIIWKHIIRLYFTFKNNNFRKSYKLNSQNVFPNSYSKMKVIYAAQILSALVAQHLKDQNWPGTAETVKFLQNCNKFFDILNGAHSSLGKRKKNPDLEPYTQETIKEEQRFVWLESFIDYLLAWKKQVDCRPLPSAKKEKMLLPIQTMIGVELSIRGIHGAISYFLDPLKGQGKFVNARVFSQDPLEQQFSSQRCGRAGSRNPNVSQFQQKQVASALHREVGVKKRKANSSESEAGLQLSTDPVPKLKRPRRK